MSANLNGRTPPRQGKGVRPASIQPAFQSVGDVAFRSTYVLHYPLFLGQTEREQSMDTRAWHVPNPAIIMPTSDVEATRKTAILPSWKDRAHG